MKISRIKCDFVTIMALVTLVTYSKARPQHAQHQQPQPGEHDDTASDGRQSTYNSEPLIQDPKIPAKITLLPFYGGAKGQTLKIIEAVDGTVTTEIIQGERQPVRSEELVEAQEELIESSAVPVRRESEYGLNIKNIHKSALNILRLQEAAKSTGLNEEDAAAYKEYMDSLNQSAHNLAKINEREDDDVDSHTRAGLSGWFARKKTTAPPKKENKDKDKDMKKEEENKKKQGQITDEAKKKEEEAKRKAEEARKKHEEAKKKAEAEAKKKAAEEEAKKKKEEEEKKRKVEEEEKKRKEEEEKKKQEQEHQVQEGEEGPAQTPETSVAEAKPVGLAVAGIGGVASSKPVATAVVGPGGLAIARPVGTAIAGVSPDQTLVPIYAEGYVVPKPASSKKPSHSSDYLNKIIAKYHQA